MRRFLSVGVIVAAAALIALLAYGVASKSTDSTIDDALAKGQRPAAPQASLPVLGGNADGSLADYRGEVVVLNFWASWCPPCVDELPLLVRTQRRLERRGATVLGVNVKDFPEDADKFVKRFGIQFPSIRDRNGEYADKYGARAFPETFVIDRRGRVAALRRGEVDQRWLDQTLPRLLAEGS